MRLWVSALFMFYAIDEGCHSRSGDTPYKNITLLVTAMHRIQYYNYPHMAICYWWRYCTAIREWWRFYLILIFYIFSYGDSPSVEISIMLLEYKVN